MRKLLVFLVGLVAVLLAARWYLGTSVPSDPARNGEASEPKRRLDNLRERRKAIEADEQKRLGEAMEKSGDSQK